MIAQSRVDEVRGRVVRANLVAALRIDGEMHGVADCDRSGIDLAMMCVETPKRLRGIGYRNLKAMVAVDDACIAGLTAALASRGVIAEEGSDARREDGAFVTRIFLRVA